MITTLLVLSGGQSGADIGALRAAKAAGFKTGGWMPKGWLTEDGPRPEYADLYGLRELAGADYRERTIANVGTASAVLWYGNPTSRGGRLTIKTACANGLTPTLVWLEEKQPQRTAENVAQWVVLQPPGLSGSLQLMLAGNRESVSPGIAALVEHHFGEVLHILKEKGVS